MCWKLGPYRLLKKFVKQIDAGTSQTLCKEGMFLPILQKRKACSYEEVMGGAHPCGAW